MKKKNLKLNFKKETVSVLQRNEMQNINGGSSMQCVYEGAMLVTGILGAWEFFHPDHSYNINEGIQANSDNTCVSCDNIDGACVISDVYVCG